jgi:hypothetical protein
MILRGTLDPTPCRNRHSDGPQTPSIIGGIRLQTPRRLRPCTLPIALLVLAAVHIATAADDPLPSWHEGTTKRAIVDFVQRVTTPGGPDFVPVPERIATFDNDGTLWAEQPIYFQLAFAFDRVKAKAPEHPEWQEQEPFKSFLAGDLKGALAGGAQALVQLVMVSHAGMMTDEFVQTVKDWLATARGWTVVNMKSDWQTIFPLPAGR